MLQSSSRRRPNLAAEPGTISARLSIKRASAIPGTAAERSRIKVYIVVQGRQKSWPVSHVLLRRWHCERSDQAADQPDDDAVHCGASISRLRLLLSMRAQERVDEGARIAAHRGGRCHAAAAGAGAARNGELPATKLPTDEPLQVEGGRRWHDRKV
jgi:hypothetical protein